MNKPKSLIRASSDRRGLRARAAQWLLLLGCVGLAGFAVGAAAQTNGTVTTLGGGPVEGRSAAGYQDGPTLQEAQFNNPMGLALDLSQGILYVADRDNGRIRRLDIAGDLTETLVKGLKKPVAVVVDSLDNLYVANQGDGTIIRCNPFGDLVVVVSNLVSPAALALDEPLSLYVTELGPANASPPAGAIKRVSLLTHAVATVAAGLDRPVGLALLNSGLLAVSEMNGHVVKFINATTGEVTLTIGTPYAAGYRDGPASIAAFNQPFQLAKAPNGNLVLTDYGNHRVRLITPSGVVSTIYGIDSSKWGCPYAGWLDGDVRTAEAREPVGVTVASDGTIYTTEVYYHIIREVTGFSGTDPGEDGGATNIVAQAVTMSPNSGYLPMGQLITITNSITNALYNGEVYYTTDGSEPTTNSARLHFTNRVSAIYWRESLRDLTYLRIKTILTNGSTAIASGQPASVNQIGIHRDIYAGIGANAIIPVVVNLKNQDTIQSLQFRVEVTPRKTETPPIPDTFQTLDVDTNNFVPLAVSKKEDTTFVVYNYTYGRTRGLAITFVSSFANYSVERYGAVAVLSVPIPPEAVEGDSYSIRVLEYSATSDADQKPVILTNLPTRIITVTNLSYLVGDSVPGTWYNAGDFGDQTLDNADVNAVFYASLGLKLPYQLSDAFDTMDVFPEDIPPASGGDGLIRFLDWQTTLFRSMRLPGYTENYRRSWAPGGNRVSYSIASPSSSGESLLPAAERAARSSPTWHRPVQLIARPLEGVLPGEKVNVPIHLNVAPGCQVAGLQFRAIVRPTDKAKPPLNTVEFVSANGVAPPPRRLALGTDQTAVAWNVGGLTPNLRGSNLIGYLRFSLPANTVAGDCYLVQFAGADGAADMKTQYDFETFPAMVWVQTSAGLPQNPLSYEWTTNFFGSYTNPWAQPQADPDADGVPNIVEFYSGNNPAKLRLHPLAPDTSAQPHRMQIRWFAQPGKRYVLEATDDLQPGSWTPVSANLTGDGDILEVNDNTPATQHRFYRVRLLPTVPRSSGDPVSPLSVNTR